MHVYINIAWLSIEKKYTCSIELILDTGPQFYFGSVNFHDSNYDTHFLDRYVQFNVGDKYTSSALLQLQQNLNNSVYFFLRFCAPTRKKGAKQPSAYQHRVKRS